MRDASFLRVEAEFCLELARQINDVKTVENLQQEAARYQTEAAEIEAAQQLGSTGHLRVSVEPSTEG
jgi:hypothetical protein